MRRLVLLFLLASGLTFSQNVLDLSAPRLDQQTTTHFTFDYFVNVTPALRDLANKADEIYTYVSERINRPYRPKISVAVQPVMEAPVPQEGVEMLKGLSTLIPSLHNYFPVHFAVQGFESEGTEWFGASVAR